MRDSFARLLRRRHLYRFTFGTPEGQVVLRDLMRFCGVRQNSYVPGDPTTTAFNEGKRRVAIRIGAIMNLSDAELMRLAEQPEEAEHGED
jgi:hypothetical protein